MLSIILFDDGNMIIVETTLFTLKYTRSKYTNTKGNIISQIFRADYKFWCRLRGYRFNSNRLSLLKVYHILEVLELLWLLVYQIYCRMEEFDSVQH